MSTRRNVDTSREPGSFFAIPRAVMDSAAYRRLSFRARSLLLELAYQCNGDDNGRLLLSMKYLRTRGWKSADAVQKAKDELLESGLIFQTVQGMRPNRAGWYAITWRNLDKVAGYDPGVEKLFVRGAYRLKNESLIPTAGVGRRRIAPVRGTAKRTPVPSGGAMVREARPPSIPVDGNPLEVPSPAPRKAA